MNVDTQDMTLEEIKAHAKQAIKPNTPKQAIKPNTPKQNAELLANLVLTSSKEDIQDLANFIGKTEQRGITIVYTPHDIYLLKQNVSPYHQQHMEIRGLTRLEHQTFQVNIQGKRTQHTTWHEATQYQHKHKEPRQSLARAQKQTERAEHTLNETAIQNTELQNTVVRLTIELNKTEQQNRLLHQLTKHSYTEEQTYHQVLEYLRLKGHLNRANQIKEETIITMVATLKQVLDIKPHHKEFKELLS